MLSLLRTRHNTVFKFVFLSVEMIQVSVIQFLRCFSIARSKETKIY